jgi:hypothetical protein
MIIPLSTPFLFRSINFQVACCILLPTVIVKLNSGEVWNITENKYQLVVWCTINNSKKIYHEVSCLQNKSWCWSRNFTYLTNIWWTVQDVYYENFIECQKQEHMEIYCHGFYLPLWHVPMQRITLHFIRYLNSQSSTQILVIFLCEIHTCVIHKLIRYLVDVDDTVPLVWWPQIFQWTN